MLSLVGEAAYQEIGRMMVHTVMLRALGVVRRTRWVAD
jgi:hypothetical protein